MKILIRKGPARYIRMHEKDNVGVIANEGGIVANAKFDDGLAALEPIGQCQKITLEDIEAGGRVVRYGQTIGVARRPLPRGSAVREADLVMPEAPALGALPLADRTPPEPEPLLGYTFEGYRNPDGTVGTRNILGITTTVPCVAGVLDHAIDRIRRELLSKYRNVDAVVALNHSYGCGVAIQAPGAEIPIRTVRNLARNPNLGGQALGVGLGCEKLQPEQVVTGEGDGLDLDDTWFYRLQESGSGFGEMITRIMAMAEVRLRKLDLRRRETCPASDLIVGMQCGGSDAFSGITANPALGFAADLIVRAGGTVMFSEVTEVRDSVYLLTSRAQSEDVARDLIREMDWYDRYLESGGANRSANTSPGNKAGGLSNIVEKSLGSTAKSGSSAIRGVLGPGERVDRKGLIYCATPASDFICGTLQLAAGMNLHVFTTGRGTPYGLAMAPVVKVSTRTELKERWPDLIDINAGGIADGSATIESVGWELFRFYLEVASGRRTWSEQHGLCNDLALFNPAPIT
jgi:galactarate dehydratase